MTIKVKNYCLEASHIKIMKLLCFRIGPSNCSSDMEKDWIDTTID
jgi:hypothetical protein